MAYRRRRNLSYRPEILRRTPIWVYALLALLCVGGFFYSKQNLVKQVAGRVIDAYTGVPLPGADVVLLNDKPLARTAGIGETAKTSTDNAGYFQFDQATDKYTVAIQFRNYRSATFQQSGVYSSELKLVPTLLHGQVHDEAGQPVAHASIALVPKNSQDQSRVAESDTSGNFSFNNAPEAGSVSARAAGYRLGSLSFEKTVEVSLTLQSFRVHAAYLAPAAVTNPATLETSLNTIAPTQLTAVVVDLKDESGKILYASKVPGADKAEAAPDQLLTNLPATVKALKDHRMYTIARIVCYQDPVLTDLKPEWTLKNKATGKPWTDSGGYNWINPYNQDAWNFYISLAEEAARAGFDEVDFDGLHFPVLGDLKDVDYGRPSDATSRVAAITGFLKAARARLSPLGIYTSVNVFGSALIEAGDLGIGMDVTALAAQVDYLSPMIYPVEWEPGAFGIDQPATKPYDLVKQSMLSARSRLADRLGQVRPWLQDFSRNNVTYGESQVRDEIRAVEEFQTGTAAGWVLFNPTSHYTLAAVTGKS